MDEIKLKGYLSYYGWGHLDFSIVGEPALEEVVRQALRSQVQALKANLTKKELVSLVKESLKRLIPQKVIVVKVSYPNETLSTMVVRGLGVLPKVRTRFERIPQ